MAESNSINGDNLTFMKSLPDRFFDLVIDDPPYGLGLDMVIGVDQNKRQGRKTMLKHESKDWNDHIQSEEYFNELHRVSKHQIIWGCNYYAKYIPAVGRIVHDKIMGTEDTKFNWSHADLASCSLFKRIVMFRYQWAGNKQNGTINWDNAGLDGRIHPVQKPVALYKWCFTKFSGTGQKVYDPHMGSQSSRIAAYDLGIDYWGTEMDSEYFAKGEKRFRQHKAQTVIQF